MNRVLYRKFSTLKFGQTGASESFRKDCCRALAETELRAPMEGIVGRRMVSRNERAAQPACNDPAEYADL